MAKSKKETIVEDTMIQNEVNEIEVNEIPETNEKKTNSNVSGPTYDELLSIVKNLAGELNALKSNLNNNQSSTLSEVRESKTDSATAELINLLANRKSDKEVVIVHNCELINGLTTHIELTGITIDFRTIGEQRVLSWQQFEECVSKYRNWFDKEIILLGDEYPELAQRYSIPCVKRGNNHIITHDEINEIQNYDIHKLETFINTLTDEDKNFVYSYWLGNCYEKKEGFYDRYKIEMLNRLSGKHIFDNLLTLMNGDFREEQDK